MYKKVETIYNSLLKELVAIFNINNYYFSDPPELTFSTSFSIPTVDDTMGQECYYMLLSYKQWNTNGLFADFITESKDDVFENFQPNKITVYINVINSYCEVFNVEYDNFIYIVLTHALSRWIVYSLYNSYNYEWEEDSFNNNDQESKEVITTIAQLLSYKFLENKPIILKEFIILSEKQDLEYRLYDLLKWRSFAQIGLDIINLRSFSGYTLSKWRFITMNDDYWLQVFRNGNLNSKIVSKFFTDKVSFDTINIWFERGEVDVRDVIRWQNELISMNIEIPKSFPMRGLEDLIMAHYR